MNPLLKLHGMTLAGLVLAANGGLLVYLAAGHIKLWAEINWMDVVGEGGTCLILCGWLVMFGSLHLPALPARRLSS